LNRTTRAREQSSVLIVAPVAPPYGGMASQALLLKRMLEDDGIPADILSQNQPFAQPFRIFERVPVLRALLRTGIFCVRMWRRCRTIQVVHILAASWLHFFLVVCPAILIGRLRGRRVILNYRGGLAGEFLERCAWLARPWFQMADMVTTPSEFLARIIRAHAKVPISIVPNIVDFSNFRYRERSSFQPRMLVTRHLEKMYDVEMLLRAFKEIQASYPAASLWIAGSGSEEGRLRALAAEWKLSGVRFLGYVDRQKLPAIYNECDILLNASRVDNFPGSLLDASAAGLAVVSTNAGGIPFIYTDGENALLVEIGDWRGLAAAVSRLLQDEPLAHALATAGHRLCRQCDWQNIRRSLYESYGFVPPFKQEGNSDDRRVTYSRAVKEQV